MNNHVKSNSCLKKAYLHSLQNYDLFEVSIDMYTIRMRQSNRPSFKIATAFYPEFVHFLK